MSLAIFDLDNTLIAGDSDYLWGRFLVSRGVVDKDYYEQSNAHFYQQYKQGTLNIAEFLAFALKPLADNELQHLYIWRDDFIAEVIKPLLLKRAHQLVAKHRSNGDTLLVITATNRFITEPIVKLYGIENLLATTPEFANGRYTGRFVGEPCFQHGKVIQLQGWLEKSGETLENSWFYSDSHNDVPLLKLVDHPVAVDPDENLKALALSVNWPVISLRDSSTESYHCK